MKRTRSNLKLLLTTEPLVSSFNSSTKYLVHKNSLTGLTNSSRNKSNNRPFLKNSTFLCPRKPSVSLRKNKNPKLSQDLKSNPPEHSELDAIVKELESDLQKLKTKNTQLKLENQKALQNKQKLAEIISENQSIKGITHDPLYKLMDQLKSSICKIYNK